MLIQYADGKPEKNQETMQELPDLASSIKIVYFHTFLNLIFCGSLQLAKCH